MAIDMRFLSFVAAVTALGVTANLTGCTSDNGDDDDDGGSGATAGAATTAGSANAGASHAGSSAGGSSGVNPGGAVCAAPIPVSATTLGIADFDKYDGSTDLAKWSFPLGGDSKSGVYAGPFGYGDRADNKAETFEMGEGNESTYSMRVADSMAENFGGGEGIWLSACLDATKLSGISFWARGDAPKGEAVFTLSMGESTPATAAKTGDKTGSCPGDAMTCVGPKFTFPLTDTWTEIKVAWADFTPGDAAGKGIVPDGHNITQVQFAVELNWVPNDAGEYAPVPAPYELAIDSVAFY